MKKLVLSIIITSFFFISYSQVTDGEAKLVDKTTVKDTLDGWKTGGVMSITLNQVSLTNWAAGGLNSISLGGFFNVYANLKKGKNTWDNNLDLAYGIIRQGDSKAVWIKNDDRIDFTSKYGRQIKNSWYYAALVNFRSQFAPGYATPLKINKISDLLSPAYVLGAIGLDFKPNESFYLFLAPLTSKTTIVNDQKLANAGAFGVEKAVYDATTGNVITAGKNIRNEFGGYLKMVYQKTIMENIGFQTTLDLFSTYTHNPQNIDVNWQNMVTMKVNEHISASLSTHLIYDDDIDIGVDSNNDGINEKVGSRTQFKQTFGAGFSYKF